MKKKKKKKYTKQHQKLTRDKNQNRTHNARCAMSNTTNVYSQKYWLHRMSAQNADIKIINRQNKLQ